MVISSQKIGKWVGNHVPSSVLPLNRNNTYISSDIIAEEIAEEAEEEWRFWGKNNKNPFDECISLNRILGMS